MTKSTRKFKDVGKLFSEPEELETGPDTVDEKKKKNQKKVEENKSKHVAHHDLSGPRGMAPDKSGYRSSK